MFSILTRWWFGKGFNPVILLTIICIQNALAQVVQTKRFEISLAENEQSFEVAPAGDKGVFIYRRLASLETDVLEISFVDTAFQAKWHGYLPIERNYVITGRKFFDNSLYFVLRFVDFSKNDLKIISINYEQGMYLQYPIKNFIPFTPIEFHVTTKAALIGGYFNKTPVVIYFDFETKKSRIVPGLFNEPGDLTQIKTYPDGSFDILVSAKNMARKKTIWIKNYDSEGDVIKNIMIEPEGNKNLIFGRSIKTPDNMQIVAGTYSTNASEYSKGIFVASVFPTGEQQVRYYNYADLENFFKYMRAKREARVKNRIQRRRIKGRKLRFNYRLLVHELVPYHGQFILLGEAFYPKYIYGDNYRGMFYSNMTTARGPVYQNGKLFDGYYYTHAVTLGLSENGKLLWDNSFEINDVRTFTLEQFVKLDADDEKLTLLYLFNNEIRSKIIKDNNVVEGKSFNPIMLKSETDFTKNRDGTDLNRLEYWYDHYFMAHGTQWINTVQRGMSPKGRVFFINKVTHR